MSRIAITGYVNLSDELTKWLQTEFSTRLATSVAPGWCGITCLARGVDQLFATAVISFRGRFEVVLPAHDYEHVAIDDTNRSVFQHLLAQADDVQIMDFEASDRQAYLAASLEMLDRCDRLLAVWDGTPSQEVGDTADVVSQAKERDIPVDVMWPPAGHAAALRPRPDDAVAARLTPASALGHG